MSDAGKLRFYTLTTPWIVLAVSVLISACWHGNFWPIKMLRTPMRFGGPLSGGRLQLVVQGGFPIQDSVIKTDNKVLEIVARNFPIPMKRQVIEQNTEAVSINFNALPTDQMPLEGFLEYYPLYRFLSEQYMFDADGQVARYAADCIRFILKRDGFTPVVTEEYESCRVETGVGVDLVFSGMTSLTSLKIHEPASADIGETVFELDRCRIRISKHMFPEVFEAGEQILTSGDELVNLTVSSENGHVIFQSSGDT